MNKLILKLSEVELIEFVADNNIDFERIDYCCGGVKAYFINEKEERLCIGQESAGLFFEALITPLKKSVNNKLQLHESLTQNLGVLWNEKFQGKSGFFMVPTLSGKGKYWIGLDYEIWEVSDGINQYVTTWLYNDHEGNIILEVTKFYKWSIREPELEDPSFETYEEFMKDYKPLIHRIIPHDVAVQWLGQAMKIHRSFFSTEENYQNLCKILKW